MASKPKVQATLQLVPSDPLLLEFSFQRREFGSRAGELEALALQVEGVIESQMADDGHTLVMVLATFYATNRRRGEAVARAAAKHLDLSIKGRIMVRRPN